VRFESNILSDAKTQDAVNVITAGHARNDGESAMRGMPAPSLEIEWLMITIITQSQAIDTAIMITITYKRS